MVKIFDNDLNLTIYLEGSIAEKPKYLGHSEIMSIKGNRFTEKIRSVIDIELTIEYLEESDYKKLKDIFLYGNNALEIEDLDNGTPYTSYYINGDSIVLNKLEDEDRKTYYYKGNLSLNKR